MGWLHFSVALSGILKGDNPFSGIGNLHHLSGRVYPHTELGIDLKLLMQTPGRPPVGAKYDGTIIHDSEDHYLFYHKKEKVKTVHRNPVIFTGGCVNVHLLADGSKSFEFNRPRLDSAYRIHCFCRKAIKELQAIEGLLGNY